MSTSSPAARRQRRRRECVPSIAAVTAAAATLVSLACGGSSPTGPAPPGSGVTIRFVGSALAARETVVRREIERTWELASAELPIDGLEVVVDSSLHVIPGWGVGGSAPRTGRSIEVSVDPALDEATLVERLPSIAAHEMHHAARHRAPPGYGDTLLQAMVSEGLADHYAAELFGRPEPPWVTALSEPEMETWIERAGPELDSSSYNHSVWFFGTGAVPHWAGYAIGSKLVRDYKAANPGATALSLVHADAEIFRPSD